VRILDKFTELTTEFNKELKLRQKQYDYYRDKFLTFPQDKVAWKRLGDVAEIKHGKDWKKLNTGNIPVYGSGGIMGYVDRYAYDKPSVLIPRKGSITNIFYVDTVFWNVDTIYYTKIDTTKLIPKYLQGRIVAILDRFETLTNSLQEGLPREIELRQKQYAYYRNMLLDFPKN